MKISEMAKRAHESAIKRKVYNCECCHGTGYIMDHHEIEKNDCRHCATTGRTAMFNIIQKIKEETLELQEAFIERKIANIAEFQNIDMESNSMFIELFEKFMKNSEGDELADIIIVCMAAAIELGIDIESHVIQKLKYNALRG